MNKILIVLFAVAFGANPAFAQSSSSSSTAEAGSSGSSRSSGAVGSGIPETVGRKGTVGSGIPETVGTSGLDKNKRSTHVDEKSSPNSGSESVNASDSESLSASKPNRPSGAVGSGIPETVGRKGTVGSGIPETVGTSELNKPKPVK